VAGLPAGQAGLISDKSSGGSAFLSRCSSREPWIYGLDPNQNIARRLFALRPCNSSAIMALLYTEGVFDSY